MNRTEPHASIRGNHRRVVACLLGALAVILLIASLAGAGVPLHAVPNLTADYTQTASIYVRVVRTGWSEAAVLGVQNGTGSAVAVSILVNGAVKNSTTTIYNGEFWSLHVSVANGSSVQAVIGSYISNPASVPAYRPQPVTPGGIIYARGSQLFVNGTPVQLFGVDEETGFTYAMIAAGLCGWTNPSQYWGNNQLFPSGPSTKIPGVSSVDQYWQKFFQYFLHYNQVAGNATNPKINVIRITVVDDTFVPEGAYWAWKNNPTTFWQIFDSMLYWAGRAGLYVVPVLGHIAQKGTSTVETWYDTSTPQFAHHVALVQAILARYNNNTRIAMWDLWNEPEVNNDVYWASVGGITGFRAWATTLISAVKPYSSNHLLTMGTCGWTLFPGIPGFGWEYYFFFNDMPGLDVASNHYYATAQDQYLVTWQTDWHKGLNIPEFQGEFGYGASGGNQLGYGYWPWFAQHTMAAGWSVATMVFLNDGVGPYADYPYLGSLPSYPNGTAPGPQGPVASFVVTPSSPVAGTAATFDGSLSSDTATITSYAWTFGDGGSGTGAVLSHTYASAGTYLASLKVTDTNAASNTTSRSVQVTSAQPPPADTTPPAQVTDLQTTSVGATAVALRWTAPGNNGTTGQATQYDLRYNTLGPLDDTNFTSGVRVPTPAPSPAGTTETLSVTGLTPATDYWFALRTADAVPNWSPVSNDAVTTTASPPMSPTPPSVTTFAATARGQTTATLNGNLGSLGSGSPVTVGFWYGTSPTLAGALNATAGSVTIPGSFSLKINGLTSGGVYYFSAWANGTGFASGAVLNFTSSNPGTLAPRANTHKPHGSTATTATVSGNVSSLGNASAVNVGFLISTSPTLFGAMNVTVSTLADPAEFQLSVSGLAPNTVYYYEAWAAGQGFALGGILNVSTSALLPPSVAPAVLGVTYSPETQSLDIAFSQPMNRSSVQDAVAISPSVSYQLVWVNDSHVQLQLESALTANQDYGLTVGSTALSASGQPMGDPFTFRFTAPPAASIAAPNLWDALWLTWLPWIVLGLAALWAIALLLHIRGRRKLRALRDKTRLLARRIDELRTENSRLTPKAASPPALRPVPVRRVPLKVAPRGGTGSGKPLSGP